MLSGFGYHTLTAYIRRKALCVLLVPSKRSSRQKSAYRPSRSPAPVTLAEHASPKHFLGAYAGLCSFVVPRYRKGWRGDLCLARRAYRAGAVNGVRTTQRDTERGGTHLIPAQHDSHDQGKVARRREIRNIPCNDPAKLAAVEDVGEEAVSGGFVLRHGAVSGVLEGAVLITRAQ